MRLILIRHGKTFGNTKKRYIGITDEDLCEEGRNELRDKKEQYQFHPDYLFVSPLKRCRQSAELLFPGVKQIVAEDLRECDFGAFENKNFEELSKNPDYQAWIDSNGTLPFPNGESQAVFKARVVKGFHRIIESLPLESDKTAVFVVHGGTIMSIQEHLNKDPEKSYFDFQVKNGEAVIIEHMVAINADSCYDNVESEV